MAKRNRRKKSRRKALTKKKTALTEVGTRLARARGPTSYRRGGPHIAESAGIFAAETEKYRRETERKQVEKERVKVIALENEVIRERSEMRMEDGRSARVARDAKYAAAAAAFRFGTKARDLNQTFRDARTSINIAARKAATPVPTTTFGLSGFGALLGVAEPPAAPSSANNPVSGTQSSITARREAGVNPMYVSDAPPPPLPDSDDSDLLRPPSPEPAPVSRHVPVSHPPAPTTAPVPVSAPIPRAAGVPGPPTSTALVVPPVAPIPREFSSVMVVAPSTDLSVPSESTEVSMHLNRGPVWNPDDILANTTGKRSESMPDPFHKWHRTGEMVPPNITNDNESHQAYKIRREDFSRNKQLPVGAKPRERIRKIRVK